MDFERKNSLYNTGNVYEALKKDYKEKEARRLKEEAARNGVADMKVKTRIIYDGGKTEENDYTVTTHSGRIFTFNERNVFKEGREITPTYEGTEGLVHGIVIKDITDNKFYWHSLHPQAGYRPVRPLDSDELAAYTAVEVLGRFAHSDIRE